MVGEELKVTRREPVNVLVGQKKHGVLCTVVVIVELWGTATPP
jgi:hypothetical protein